jgi:hypothetical protein
VFEARLLVGDANHDNDWGEVWADIINCSYVDAATSMLRTIANSATTPLLGDYNLDGTVDAADYIVWRSSLGQSVPPFTGSDGDYDAVIDQGDYAVWRANFGRSAAPAVAGAAFLVDESSETGLDGQAAIKDINDLEKSRSRPAFDPETTFIPRVFTPATSPMVKSNRGARNALAQTSYLHLERDLAIDAWVRMQQYDRRRYCSLEGFSLRQAEAGNPAVESIVESLDLAFNRLLTYRIQ